MLKASIALAICGAALLLSPVFLRSAAQQPSTTTPPSTKPAADADVAYGKALFSAKGCVQCHAHAAVQQSGRFSEAYGSNGAPNLTVYQRDPSFLRRWLKDPSAVKPGTAMPTLGLSDTEIEALIAFLNTRQQ